MIKGIDVSHYQGDIDWPKVKADGVNFVFIKATQGVGYSKVDYFRNHAPKAAGFGLHVGAYHYGTFSNIPEALAEANYFYSVVKDYKLTYPVVLDLEENKDSVSRKQLTDAALAFMDFFKQKGYRVLFYTSKGFLDNQLDASCIKYPLWIARYYKELGCDADIWQHTDQGKVNGVSTLVDMNIAYKDFALITDTKEVIPPYVPTNNGVIAKVKVLVDGLNIRVAPDVRADVTRKAKKDEVFNVFANVNDWHNVGGANWMFGNNGKYLSLVKEDPKPEYPGYPIKNGSTNTLAIKEIQKEVGVISDGVWGPKTDAAVKAWQKKNSLAADGIIGPKSWSKMF
jgi:lysozyme